MQKTPASVLFGEIPVEELRFVQTTQQAYIYNGKEAWVYRVSTASREDANWAGWNVMNDGEIVARGFETHAEAANWAQEFLYGRVDAAPDGRTLEAPAAVKCQAADDEGLVRKMSCIEFLRLAASAEIKADRWNPDLISEWTEWPTLEAVPRGGQVLSHEGRHRVAALAAAGYLHVEVVLLPTPDPRDNPRPDWKWDGFMAENLSPEDDWKRAIGA